MLLLCVLSCVVICGCLLWLVVVRCGALLCALTGSCVFSCVVVCSCGLACVVVP